MGDVQDVSVDVDLPYLVTDEDRHGNERIYVRRFGRKIRIRAAAGAPEFLEQYRGACEALTRPVPAGARIGHNQPNTLGWLATQYFQSGKFTKLDPRSQRVRRSVIEKCLQEPTTPGGQFLMQDCPIQRLTTAAVIMLRDRVVDRPGAANNRKKYIGAMFSWAVEAGHMVSNVARDAKRIHYATDGFRAWTEEDVAQYERAHPIGTKARLALALLLYLGPRRGDVVRLGKQHRLPTGEIRFIPTKTSYKRRDSTPKPVLPVLDHILSKSPVGELTFLVTEHGRPFTANGFGNKMREWCDEAGLYDCSAHGVRKIAAIRCAEGGATTAQLMALFDWVTPSQAEVYIRMARQRLLAAQAVGILEARSGTQSVPPTVPLEKTLDSSVG